MLGGRQAARPVGGADGGDVQAPSAVKVVRGVAEATHAAGAGTVVSAIHERSGDARERERPWATGRRSATTPRPAGGSP